MRTKEQIEKRMQEVEIEYNRNTAMVNARKITHQEWDLNATRLYNEYKALQQELKEVLSTVYDLSKVLESAKEYAKEMGHKLETKGLERGKNVLSINFIDEEMEIDAKFIFIVEVDKDILLRVECYNHGHFEDFSYFEDVESAIKWCF